MESVGAPLDPWQAQLIIDTFGLRDDGYWAAFEAACFVSRQNGKGRYTEAIELAGLFLFHDELIMHSAHLFKTSKQSFQRLVDIINASDWLTKRVQKITRARGDEEVLLTKRAGGGRLLYFSRAGGAGRGFTGDKTIFDECAYLTIEQYQAATPTLATVPNPQIIYTGTPPDEDVGPMPEDAMIPSVRQRGLAGGDRIMLAEWSPADEDRADPKVWGERRKDPKVWAACNPSMGKRIAPWFLKKQLENFSAAGKPEKYDTEHLGVWPNYGGAQWSVISEAQWLAASDALSIARDPIAFSIDVNPERTMACIAAVGEREDGDLHGEIIEHRPGTDWVVSRAIQLVDTWRPCAISVVGVGASFTLYPALTKGLTEIASILEVKVMNSRELAAAFGMTVDAAKAKRGTAAGDEPDEPREYEPAEGELKLAQRLWWRSDRYGDALSEAVKGGVKKWMGEGSVWDRASSSVDITPIVALTNAVHTFVSAEVPPPAAAANPAKLAAQNGQNMFRPTGRLKL